MSKNKNLGEGGVEERRPSALERLREEITVLRIEGTLFCFDPKEPGVDVAPSPTRFVMPMALSDR
jgi:hypothetical protein